MTYAAAISQSAIIVVAAIAGLVFALLYFAALKRSVLLFVGGSGWLHPLALTLGRVTAAVAFLFIAAKLGAAPLLAAFIGFLTARALATRAQRRVG